VTGSRMTDVERILDRAVEAADRSDWATALRLADEVLAIDPDNSYAAALRTLTVYRGERKRGRAPGTRRRVSVVFCDMVGSTALAAGMDPEEMRGVLQDFLRSCAEVVEEFDGHVASLLGDGLLAYFGFPRAHEDDAARAVLAGRAIVERVRALPAVHVGDATIVPAVRVGIHTGLAAVATLGTADRLDTNDVVGEPPHLAARIQGVAEANSVVISSETADLLNDMFDLRPLPPTPLKGIRRRVDLLEVGGRRQRPTHVDGATQSRARLVNRRQERGAIKAAWTAARRSGGRALALLGDPGIGKSRLVAYARDTATAAGGSHLTLQCSPHQTTTALYPIASLLEQEAWTTSRDPDDRRPRLAEVAARLGLADPESLFILARLLRVEPPADVPLLQLGPEQLRERTLALLAAWLERRASQSPLLVAVEDLHWADPTTLELLARGLARRTSLPILILLTSREAGPLAGLGEVSTLVVGPLGPKDAARIVDDAAGDVDVPEAARRLIIQRSDGVPLFAEELTRMLRRAGSDPQFDLAEIDVPPTLVDLLVARLDQYPTELRLAGVIATVGLPVNLRLLSQLLPLGRDELRRQLDVLVEAQLLRTIGDDSDPAYEFRHTLQREAAYQLQLHATRREVHAEVAAALSGPAPAVPASPELIAYHHERADDFAAAAQDWYRAGVQHASVAAHAEAIQDFERSLAALERARAQVPERLEVQVRAQLAASLLAIRGYTSPEVVSAFERLRGLAESGGRQELPSLFGVWAYYHTRGDNRVSGRVAQSMLHTATSSGGAEDVLAAKAVVGKQLLWDGRFRPAAAMLKSAGAYRPLDSPSPFPHDPGIGATIHLAIVLWILGQPRRAEAALAEAVARAEALDAPNAEFTRAYTHCYAASLCHVTGDMAGFAQHARRTTEIATERGFATWRAAGGLFLACVGALTREPSEYIPAIRLGLAAWRQAGAEAGRTQVLLCLAQAHLAGGQPQEALEALDEGLDHAASTGELMLESPLRRLRGEVLSAVGPPDGRRAETELVAAAEVARRQGARAFENAATRALEPVRPVRQARS
jgi:class 3 adenylate cyclase/tetratricopeptide (TPR) repeat protein